MMAFRSRLRSLFVRFFRLTNGRKFGKFGRRIYVFPGIDVLGADRIEIGDDVIILDDSVLAVHQNAVNGSLRIGAGTQIGRRNHIYALSQVELGANVLTASNVYISDCTHAFDKPELPVLAQPVKALSPVRIGEGAWIGHNACIIGCSVGRNSVVGANAVVLQDVPDYSVAVGAPARVVRRLDFNSGAWISVRSRPEI